MPKKKYAIQLTPQLADGLRFLAKSTKKTQVGILEELLTPMFVKASTFHSFGYWVNETASSIVVTFFGNPNLVYGRNKDPDDQALRNAVSDKYRAISKSFEIEKVAKMQKRSA
jgi:hypothetical protein